MARLRALRSPRHRSLRKRRAVRLVLAWLVAIAAIGMAAVIFFNSPFVRITLVTVDGGTPSDDARIQSILVASLAGDYLRVVPKDSAFLFPSGALSQALEAEFPSVLSVSFSRPGLSSVTARVVLRTPSEVACLSSADASSTNDCYYADDSGVIFEPATTTVGTLMVYRISLPQGADPLGLQFIDAGRLSALADFSAGLAKIGFISRMVSILPDNQYDFDLEAASPSTDASSSPLSDMHLLIDESRPLDLTLQDFSAFWQVHAEAAFEGTEKLALSQVDMRYGDNIIYK